MEIQLIKGDITTIEVDAIINAANTSLLGGGGVDGAIHRKGGKKILEECIAIRNKQGGCKTGEAVITSAGNLPSKFVIHTVGPVWNQESLATNNLLKNCYVNSLEIAAKHQLKSIAFPNISTGIYHFPKDKAAEIAVNAVKNYQKIELFEKVLFICFDEENYKIYHEILKPTL
jgi:O-acetyl-ADP-ribose deacetylase